MNKLALEEANDLRRKVGGSEHDLGGRDLGPGGEDPAVPHRDGQHNRDRGPRPSCRRTTFRGRASKKFPEVITQAIGDADMEDIEAIFG
jgi:hypothetical protein